MNSVEIRVRRFDMSPQKNPTLLLESGLKERRRLTLPPVAVPSALTGLTSLFGMGRGETYRYNHLKLFGVPYAPRMC